MLYNLCMAIKKAKNDIDVPKDMMNTTGEKTSIGASSVGAAPQPNASTRPMRQAAFLGAVAGDCGCPRCCDYRDIAHMVMNPGSEY